MANQSGRTGDSKTGTKSGTQPRKRQASGGSSGKSTRSGTGSSAKNSARNDNPKPQPKKSSSATRAKKKRKKKIAIFVLEMVILGILLLILVGYTVLGFGKIDQQKIRIGDLNINELDSETQEILSGFTSIALFGIDNHEAGNFANGRTDTIIVVCINNDTKEVRMCSVYRDTYLNIGDGVYTKANAAYAAGGPAQAISMLDNNLDLDITDYVTVDFNAMVDIIDLLGGIELTITDDEMLAMNGLVPMGTDDQGRTVYSENYIKTLEETTGKSSLPVFAGTQVCDGVQAVAYCRVRYTAGDDYKRSERQRTVISKIIEKAKTSDVGTITKIINTVFGEISTSFSNAQIIGLATQLMGYELKDSAGFPFYKNTKSIGNSGSCVVPCDLTDNVDYLHLFMYQDDAYTPTSTVKDISYTITQKSGYTRDDADDRLYGSVSTEVAPTVESGEDVESEGN